MAKMGPVQAKMVHGEPIQVGDRTLIPVARVVSFGQARGMVGKSRYGGWGWGFVWVRPVAVLEKTLQGQRCIRIVDGTSAAVRRLVWLAGSITVVFAAIRWSLRRMRR